MLDFHSHISLTAGEVFVNENLKNKESPKFLHLMSEIVVCSGHLPKEWLVEATYNV